MKKLVAAFVFLGACGDFDTENESQRDEVQRAFDFWRGLILDGRMAESVGLMTESYRSQWVYDRLAESDRSALQWRAKLTGNARTDLDLWMTEAGKNASAGRVTTLPRTVFEDRSLTPLFVGYLKDVAADLRYEFMRMKITDIRVERDAATIWVHNSRGDPEWYEMRIEQGQWKLNHHRGT